MQYDLKKLKAIHDKKPITECIKLVKKFNDEMIQRGEELVSLLWYLEKTKRYQEYDGYKNLDFKVFVWEACHIPYNRYRELAYAYNWFPVESRELGPQVIQSIRSKVGVSKIPKVLSEVKAAVAKITKPEKRREAIDQVIKKHTPPSKTKSDVDTKAYYWRDRCMKAESKAKSLEGENRTLREQLKRLKETVVRLTREIDIDDPGTPEQPQMNA